MTPTTHPGLFQRWRVRFFGERDAVAEQLRDIARQGSWMARFAHACAFLLIVLFSLGSLVALSGDALVRVVALGAQPASIPAAISVAVSTLLVTCFDAAMLYGSAVIRILRARRAEWREMGGHIAVIAIACILEAATYLYMAAQYDTPATWAAWALVGARAGAAPIFAVYLSMARALPVGPRDILYQVELATGAGVIRDAVGIANDAAAPLARKMALYDASAVTSEQDRERLQRMIGVMDTAPTPTPLALPAPESPVRTQAAEDGGGDDETPPTGPGTPVRKSPVRTGRESRREAAAIIKLETPPEWRERAARGQKKSPVRTPRRTRRVVPVANYETQARTAWANGAKTVKKMEMATGMGHAAAQSWVRSLKAAEKARKEAAQAQAGVRQVAQ